MRAYSPGPGRGGERFRRRWGLPKSFQKKGETGKGDGAEEAKSGGARCATFFLPNALGKALYDERSAGGVIRFSPGSRTSPLGENVRKARHPGDGTRLPAAQNSSPTTSAGETFRILHKVRTKGRRVIDYGGWLGADRAANKFYD